MLNSLPQDIYSVLDLDCPACYQCQEGSQLIERQEDFDGFLKMRQEVKERIEDIPTTAQSQSNQLQDDLPEDEEEDEIESLGQNEEVIEQIPSISTIESQYDQIEVSELTIAQRNISLQGYENETQNLGRHLHTHTSVFLTLLIKARQLEPGQERTAQQFIATNGGMEDFRRLFEDEGLSFKCVKYYESENFIRSFLNSVKMDFKSKIAMIRYMQKFRQLAFKQLDKWKIDLIP